MMHCLKNIGKSLTPRVKRKDFETAWGKGDIEILRFGRYAVNWPLIATIFTRNDPNTAVIIIMKFGYIIDLYPDNAAWSFSGLLANLPIIESHASRRPRYHGHFLMDDPRSGSHPLNITAAQCP